MALERPIVISSEVDQQHVSVEPPEPTHGSDENGLMQETGKSGEHQAPENPADLPPWKPSGNFFKDTWFFVGPGWLVSVAYVDPGNYQADIQAAATTRYSLLFAVWWCCLLAIYVQVLCVRLAYCTQLTLAETQARDCQSTWRRYVAWFFAELSSMIADLPEVIGIGIACHLFFGWDYYVGVLLSLVTTMIFLATLNFGIQTLESIIVGLIGTMSVAIWVEMGLIGPNSSELVSGWVYGFVDVTAQDLFRIAGVLGSVVMPHNLYLHTAAIQSRRVVRQESVVAQAVKYCSWEPVVPILVSFFVNMAVVAITAETVYGTEDAAAVGLTDFCTYFKNIKGGCILWGVALLAAGQSSAITTTFAGQYIMDGFLNLRLPVQMRATVTRLVAIIPCVVVSIVFPDRINALVNFVNAAISFLLPFAFTPLVKYNCSERVMGKFAAKGVEKVILHVLAILVWAVNALALSMPGGGFFGEFVSGMPWSGPKIGWIILQVVLQAAYAWWNYTNLFTPVIFSPRGIEEERPPNEQFARLFGCK